jgi:NADPH:quinone reductase-like Zn-dependent oxidoreductase
MTAPGAPEVLTVREVPTPSPGPGEVLVRADAVPVLYPEIALRRGMFPLPVPPPTVFGFQAAGVIVGTGSGVDSTLAGRRVLAATGGMGTYAEFVCAPAESVANIPDGLTTDAAAAVGMGGSVALALLDRAAAESSDTVLVQAAAAGVAGYLTQLAKSGGVKRIIATAGGPVKMARAEALGADDVLDHTDPDWPQRLRDLLGDSTIDIVFDAIGGETAVRLLDVMTPVRGRMLGYGFLSGAPAQISATDLMGRGLTYTGCAGPDWLAMVAQARTAAFDRAISGRLEPLIDRALPLDQAAQAHQLVEDRLTLGTIILHPEHAAA